MQSETLNERLEKGLVEVVDFYRGMILDMCEQEFEGGDGWAFLRGRLLKALGDRGLVGRLREVLGAQLGQGGAK